MARRTGKPVGSLRYVLVGAAAGLVYALLNNAMDYWHARGVAGHPFVDLHELVDDVIPLMVGALLGIAVGYVQLRSRVAHEERGRAEELRERLLHVERNQAVWVVAAATLHELKNPLHTLGLLVEELEATPPDDTETVRDLVKRMRGQMDRALVPLDSLRTMARRHERDGTREPVATVAAQVVRDLAPVTRDSGVDLLLEGQVPASARAEASYLRIILENLIGNSLEGLRHAERKGRIRVSLEADGDQVSLSVSDDGPGLADDARAALFHPLETAKDGGLGLGLSIARTLAHAMKGELSCVALPGWATTFRLTLPAEPIA
jgi:two-component system C4-dicarboxylate transport sensor histidine kinase DctB